jgi:hypothetical protein
MRPGANGVGVAACGLALALALGAGCRPKVALEAPKEPIVINMNIKIDHEIRVKLDKDLEDAISQDKEIF